MQQKGLSNVLIVLIMVIIAAGLIGGAYYIRIKETPNQTQKSVINPQSIPLPLDETTNWKTYTNEIYGIALKYPSSAEMYKCGGESTNKPNEISGPADGNETECVFINNLTNPKAKGSISINFKKESFVDTFVTAETTDKNKTFTKINGKSAYITVHEVSSEDSERNKQVYIELSPTEYIALIGTYNDPATITLFDTILSTFKFTK